MNIQGQGRGLPAEVRFFRSVSPEPNTGCWLWGAAVNVCGYGIFKGPNSGLVHRFSWELHYGEIPESLNVLHRCDVPCCVNPEHLFLGTQHENILDMENKKRSRHPAGGVHGRAILTEDQVREIRAAKNSRGLARKYGVSRHVIQYARRPGTWKTVV